MPETTPMNFLLDAIYINNGGGKILLDYLISSLEANNVNVHYLLDDRIREDHPAVSKGKITYLKAGLWSRFKFYNAHKGIFDTVLCFGNLPPVIKTSAQVYTYFHQRLFLDIPKRLSFKNKLVLQLKSLIFKSLIANTNRFIVQTSRIKEDLTTKYSSIRINEVDVWPFYPPLSAAQVIHRKPKTYVYVSSGSEHKNHLLLLEAFSIFNKKHPETILHTTVGQENASLVTHIESLNKKGIKVINQPIATREEIACLLNSSTFCLYPSLSESLGLTIIEAIENGCMIIGADLPYMYEVCKPTLTFNPMDVTSILQALELSCGTDLKPTVQLMNNQVDILIENVFFYYED